VRLQIPPDHEYAAVPLHAGIAFAGAAQMDGEVVNPNSIYPHIRENSRSEEMQRVQQVAGRLGFKVFQCLDGKRKF